MSKTMLPKPKTIGGNRVNIGKQVTKVEKAMKNGPIKTSMDRTK